MKRRSIYITVRVDIDCPDEYYEPDIDLASELYLNCISLSDNHECEIANFEICGLNE